MNDEEARNILLALGLKYHCFAMGVPDTADLNAVISFGEDTLQSNDLDNQLSRIETAIETLFPRAKQ